MTPAENMLWQALRRNNLGGFHFRRQQLIDGFIVDFYYRECSLVIEVDGGIHDLQEEQDAEREAHLVNRGLRVLRFPNEEIIERLDLVKTKILETCLSLRHPLPGSGRAPEG